jgi:adenylate cyclase class IV
MHLNFEFKARTDNLDFFEEKLQSLNPLFIGEDHQKDTYFNVTKGRLKLREGTIENALIHYKRNNTADANNLTLFFTNMFRMLR